MAAERKDKKYTQGCTGSSRNSNQWKRQYQSSSLSKFSKSIFIFIKDKKSRYRKKSKLILMHGYHHLRDFPQEQHPPYWHHVDRAETGGISKAAVLKFGRQMEQRTAKQYAAGGKSNARGLPSRRWQNSKVFKMAEGSTAKCVFMMYSGALFATQ